RCGNWRVCPASEKAWRTNVSPVSDSGGLSCQPILQTVGKERSVAPNWRQCFRISHRNGRFSPASSIAQTAHSPLGRCPSQNALNTRLFIMAGLGPAIPDRHSRESGNPVIAAFRYLWPQWLLDGKVKPWSQADELDKPMGRRG